MIRKQVEPTKLTNEHLQDGIFYSFGIGKHCGKITNYNVIFLILNKFIEEIIGHCG